MEKWNDYDKINELWKFCWKLIDESEKNKFLNQITLNRRYINMLDFSLLVKKGKYHSECRLYGTTEKKLGRSFLIRVQSVNPLVTNAPFLYPLETSGVEKGCIGNEWAKKRKANLQARR